MPVVTLNQFAPYPTVGDVLQLARVKVNDAFGPNGLAGDLLATSQPATPVLAKSAWRQLQAQLADNGFDKLVKEIVITNFPKVYAQDTAVRVYIEWEGCYDGSVYYKQSDGFAALPQDMIVPKTVYERQTGTANEFREVIPWDGPFPEGQQSERLQWWAWENDQLYFKGATVATDLKIRYASWLPDIDTTQDSTEIPIMWADEALACLIAEKYSRPRGSTQADGLLAQAQVEIEKLCNRTARRKAPITYRRRPFGSYRQF